MVSPGPQSLWCSLAAALLSLSGDALARGLVPAGLYEIVVTQESRKAATASEPLTQQGQSLLPTTQQVCLTKKAIASGAAFHVRSEHPLRECPISDMRANDDELIFRLICAEPNAPKGKAKFVNTRTGYEGAITIDAAGKKKRTITEHHRARRVGECPNDETASVLQLHEDLLPELAAGRNPH